MKGLFRAAWRLKGAMLWRGLERAAKDPAAAQKRLLLEIIRRNRGTEYGVAHGFSEIRDPASFARRVPVNVFTDLASSVEKMKKGEAGILCDGRPVSFSVTSGTTDEPKYVPVTRRGARRTAEAVGLWASRALRDHPSMLDHGTLCITGALVEGETAGGIPFGSASGLIHRHMPRAVHAASVLPFSPTEIKNYDLRYYLMGRLAIEKRVSFIATPNPTTLLKIAETAVLRQEEIIRSIRDGVLFHAPTFGETPEDPVLMARLAASVQPNPKRARALEEIIIRYGRLLLSACWPELTLIGCWLGGSVGVQAEKLAEHFGAETPRRDLGHLASEGTFTIPVEDGTPAGVPALRNNYYEFIPEGEDQATETLSCLELEEGKRYRIIVTNWNALYRYDVQDIVEVQGFFHRAPMIAFVGKSGEMLNLTGEKLHVNHFLKAFRCLKEEHGVSTLHFSVAPNHEKLRHEILVNISPAPTIEFMRETVLPFLDCALGKANLEYDGKRKSGRLNPPRIHVMKEEWDENARRAFMEAGHRDIQYKRRAVVVEISDLDAAHIRYSVEMETKS